MIRGAIFDLDGTLVDSNEFHVLAWQETFRHFGKEIPLERLREQIGKGGDQYLPVFLTEREMREIGEEADKFRGEVFKKKYLPQVKPFPKVRELFEKLRADGKKIALASSGKEAEVRHYEKLSRDWRHGRLHDDLRPGRAFETKGGRFYRCAQPAFVAAQRSDGDRRYALRHRSGEENRAAGHRRSLWRIFRASAP